MNTMIADVDQRICAMGKSLKRLKTTWELYKRYRGFGALVQSSTLEASLAEYQAALEAYGNEQERLVELSRKATARQEEGERLCD